jgi:CRISPR-associated endonuclease/helicase Cas3
VPVPGRLIIFEAPTKPPRGLQLGRDMAQLLLRAAQNRIDLFGPATYDRYFTAYPASIVPDRDDVMTARKERNFPEVERRSRMIDDDAKAAIVVPYGGAPERIEDYRANPSRRTIRSLQPFVINVSLRDFNMLDGGHLIERIHEQVLWMTAPGRRQYDPQFGLLVDQLAPRKPAELIVDEALRRDPVPMPEPSFHLWPEDERDAFHGP